MPLLYILEQAFLVPIIDSVTITILTMTQIEGKMARCLDQDFVVLILKSKLTGVKV